MSSQNIANNNILRVWSKVNQPELIRECLEKVSREHETPSEVRVNLICNGENYIGKGFAYVSNPAFYNILVGLNPDGTKRIKTVETGNDTTTDWGNDQEQKELPSLVDLKEELVIEVNDFDIEFEAVVPNIKFDEETCSSFELLGTYVPNYVTEEGVRDVMGFYATIKEKGGVVYPKIEFIDHYQGNRQIKITFEPSTSDAILAAQMTRRVKIGPKEITFKSFFKKKEQKRGTYGSTRGRGQGTSRGGGRGRGRGNKNAAPRNIYSTSNSFQALTPSTGGGSYLSMTTGDSEESPKSSKRIGRRGKNKFY